MPWKSAGMSGDSSPRRDMIPDFDASRRTEDSKSEVLHYMNMNNIWSVSRPKTRRTGRSRGRWASLTFSFRETFVPETRRRIVVIALFSVQLQNPIMSRVISSSFRSMSMSMSSCSSGWRLRAGRTSSGNSNDGRRCSRDVEALFVVRDFRDRDHYLRLDRFRVLFGVETRPL